MSNGLPYGNAFIVSTPHLDRLGDRIYAEEMQKKKQQQDEIRHADDLMAKEVGTMRSADTADFIAKYEQYKALKKQLYNPKIQKSPKDYDRINREANIAMADAMRLSNRSQEFKDQLKGLATMRAKNPNSFSDDFLERYNAAMTTPVSKLKHPVYGDLGNTEEYVYKGGNTDFSKPFKEAAGTIRDLAEIDAGVNPNDKLTNIKKSYKGGNDPYTYYNTLIQGIYGSQKTRDFPLQVQYTPEQEAQIESAFNQLTSDPNYRKIYGITDAMKFPQSAYSTEIGRAVRLSAMENAINNLPVEKISYIANKDAAMKQQNQFTLSRQKIMEAIKQGNRKELVRIRRAFQVADQVRQDEILDDVIVGYKENPNAIPEDIKDEFKKRDGKGHSVDFNEVKFSPDGTKVQFLYKDEKGNVIPEFSAEATVSDIKERTRKKIETAQTDVTATPKTNPTTGKKETIAEKMRRLKGQK